MAKGQAKKTKKSLQEEVNSLKHERNKLKTNLENCISESGESNIILYKTFENSPLPTMIINSKQKVAFINTSFTKLFGYTLKDISTINKWLVRAYPNKKYRSKVEKEWAKDLKKSNNRLVTPRIFHVACKNHSVKDIKFSLTNSGNDYIILFLEDVTPLVEYQKKLKENERKIREIFNNTNDAIFMWNYNHNRLGRCIEVNNTALQILGYTKDEMLKLTPNKILLNNYQAGFKKYINELGTKTKIFYEAVHVTKNGKSIPVEISSRVFKLNDKKVILSISRDVSERQSVQQRLIASEERFRMIMEQSPLSMQVFNTDGSVLRVNDAWYKLWNINKDSTLLNEYNILKDNDPQSASFREAFENCLLGNTIEIPDIFFDPQKKNWGGRGRFVNSKIYPLKDDSGEIRFIVMLHEDITDRKKTDQALLDSEERFRSLYENASIGIFSYTPDCRIILANPAFLNMLGYDSFEELQKYEAMNNCIFNSEEMQYHLKTLITFGELYGLETTIRTKSGNSITVLLSAKAIRNKIREIEYIEGIAEDITDRKRAEEAIINAKREAEKSSKLKSEFLAQVSHEIRTPVNTILSFAGLLSDELSELVPEDLKPSFGMMKNAGRRMIRTIDLILNMSEIQTGTYQPVLKEIDLYDDILYNLYLEYLTGAMEKELNLTIENHSDSPVIIGDSHTIGEIFNNLINNAVKYTHRGKISIIIGKLKDDSLYVDIIDTGIGIAEEYMPFLFEAFSQEDQGYTRKFEGNGLGLALVQKYCQLNEAQIIVESKKGKGSKFRIIFDQVKIGNRSLSN